MSIAAPVRIGLGPGARLSPVEVVITRRLIGENWRIARWAWPAAALIAVAVGAVIAQFTPVTKSIWENAAQWPRWWLFAMAIALVTNYLPIVVTHGVTRRAAIRAVGVTSVLIGLGWAAFFVVGQVIEQFIYNRLGWPDEMDGPHLYDDGYDVLPMLAEYWLVFLSYLVAGALVGAIYYRFGAIRGTLLLPPALLPAVAIEILTSTGWLGAGLQDGLSIARPAVPALMITSVVVLSLAALAIQMVLRDVPIHSKK